MFAFTPRNWFAAAAAALALLGASGCRSNPGEYIWLKDVPKTMSTDSTAVALEVGDVIGIRVFNQDANSIDRVRVREDGKVAMPFLGDVDVEGVSPNDLARRLEVKLKAFINNPYVTVVLYERRPLRVSVVGKVTRPGVYELDRGAGILHALAAAGGLTPFADDGRLFVIRSGYWVDTPVPVRIRFRYGDLLSGKAPEALFHLHFGDVVVAE